MRLFLTLPLAAGLLLAQTPPPPVTPVRHLVVIFQENVSFDHYFGTYPVAANPPGEPVFQALPGTPGVNGLTGALLAHNPNLNPANGAGAGNPFRLDRSQAATSDQHHSYTPEQKAVHGGLMDLYPSSVGVAGAPAGTTALNLGYFDGNTVTALWNYAQHFTLNDNSYGTTFGPSTPGAINLVSGQTNGVIDNANGAADVTDGAGGTLTLIGDPDPAGDVCSTTTGEVASMSGPNIGDLLSARGVTWGFFAGGFDLTATNPNGTAGCNRSTNSTVTHANRKDYVPHHQPFQYYKSTANPTHARPASIAAIGKTDAANHQYDLHDFYDAVKTGSFPDVSFLKAPAYQDGHAGSSDPLDEQAFIVHVVNLLQNGADWAHTAVVIAYDDSDGWYDHQVPPLVNQSTSPADVLTGPGSCGDGHTTLAGVGKLDHAQGRCGYGPRLPMLVISPWAKANYVDHTLTDQTSIIRFVEDNWLGGQRIGQGSFDAIANSITGMLDFKKAPIGAKLLLDESTGEVTK